MSEQWAVGIDIGGTGIKVACVDSATGQLMEDQLRIPTPEPSTATHVAQAVGQALDQLEERSRHTIPHGIRSLPIGLAFPGSIRRGKVTFLGNLDQSWVGEDVTSVFSSVTGAECVFLNDADAAGLAEIRFGAGTQAHDKSVLMLTLGTGIGSALFTKGQLYPYTEFGHITVEGKNAERYASVSTKDREGLSYEEWAQRLQKYVDQIVLLTNPELIILGGWISSQHASWLHLIDSPVPVVTAQLHNDAGIVGAAMYAHEHA
ncbi:polyphosphate--glucose phosphotransferase [Brevibacterium paucivorans]